MARANGKKLWIWIAFLLCYTRYAGITAWDILLPDTALRGYYHCLMSIHWIYHIEFLASGLLALFNLLTIIPLYGQILNRHWLPTIWWKAFLIVRIVLEITGHGFDIKIFQSLWHSYPLVAVLNLVPALCWLVPSYLILYCHAAHREVLPGE